MNRYRLWVLAAIVHLGVVATFLWGETRTDAKSRSAQAIETYRMVAGLFRDYRFFAPSVASDVRAGAILERADGRSSFVAIASDNHEVNLRVNCILSSAMREPVIQDTMARSFAAAAMANEPEAVRATIVAEAFDVPTLPAFTDGAVPQWRLLYTGSFERQ